MYGSLSVLSTSYTDSGFIDKKDSFLPTLQSSFDILFNDNKKFHPLCKSKKLSKIRRQVDGNLHMITFWLSPVLDL